MDNSPLTLFCLVDGESTFNAFPIEIALAKTIGDLKDLIKTKKAPEFDDIAADKLALWRIDHPVIAANKHNPILLSAINSPTELDPIDGISDVFPEAPRKKTIHIIVQRPSQAETLKRLLDRDPREMPQKKKIRIEENWRPFTASDGTQVDLPPSWINILSSLEFEPEPRAAFDHLKGDLRAGDAINMPDLGQLPKEFGSHGQGHRLFVTEQMVDLWEDIRVDKDRTYRRILSGPMGVGKSYLSYFLAAKAYAEGWLVLYISDAGLLGTKTEGASTLEVVKRFLAMNKDILTGTEFEMLVRNYNGTDDISTDAVSIIFGQLLKSRDRKTLLLVDEHGKLFQHKPYIPVKFVSLGPLMSYALWGETAIGTRLIFTGTAHAKYEMEVLEESYRPRSVVFVGPLSRHVFSRLLDTYPRLAAPDIREEVIAITNCVPRELVNLSAKVEDLPGPISVDELEQWTENRTKYYQSTAEAYYYSRDPLRKERFYKALLQTFLGSTSTVNFEWDFLDLGLIYRSNDVGKIATQHHILCRPAQRALLELFKMLPLPEAIKKRIYDGTLSGDQFEEALCHQLICTNKPIELKATDLNGNNVTTIALNFSHCDTLQFGKTSLGYGHENVLTRGYDRYPRFDFMLGPMFIQASISDFASHNTESADLSKAFNVRDDNGTNQIERYLNDLYGPGHSAKIDGNRFVVTKNDVPVPGFRIVYIRGSPGKLSHRALVKKFPDVRHISFEEVRDNLFKNILQ